MKNMRQFIFFLNSTVWPIETMQKVMQYKLWFFPQGNRVFDAFRYRHTELGSTHFDD